MTNAKTTKKALLTSALSLVLCFSMLLGTTFAWFTDSVTSANNIIKSGNLDIKLEYWKGNDWVDVAGKSDILSNTLWEPGVTEVAYLRVANAGSLALKYQLGVNIVSEIAGKNGAGEEFYLSEYLMFDVVGITADATTKAPATYADRDTALGAVANGKQLKAGYTNSASLAPQDEFYLALIVYMPTTVGNEANHNGVNIPQIDLGINILATQYAAEDDSFGKDYDTNSTFPTVTIQTKPVGQSASVSTEEVQTNIPAGAPAGEYVLEVSNKNVVTNETTGQTTVSYDINLSKDGVKISTPSGDITYEINIDIGKNLNVVQVKHKGEEVDFYSYDPMTGIVSFKTASFSPFEVICEDADEDSVFLPATPEAAEKLDKANVVAVDENGVEYATLTAAVKSGASKLYLKEGSDLGTITHLDVANDLVIYGNGAYISGGERDFAIDTYAKLTKDITVTVYNLHGLAFWGQRNTAYTVNLNLYNCNNLGRVYLNGTSGANNISLYNCTASAGNVKTYENLVGDTAVYSNANGIITVDGCTFTNIGCPINLNHKIAGEQTVTVTNSTFENCATEGTAAYYAPIRLYNSAEGANQTLTVSGNTFTYSEGKAPINNADVLLNAKHNGADATGTIVASVQTSAVSSSGVNVTLTNAIYTAEDLFVIANDVNKVEEFEKNVWDGKTVVLMCDIDLGGVEWSPIGNFGNSSKQFTGTFDGQNHVISNFKITQKTPDRPGKDRSPHGFFGNVNGTIKNLTLDGAVMDVQNAKWAGTLVGRLNGGLIENCHVTNSSVTFYNWQVGGLVGQMYASKISGCSVTNSKVNAYAQLGGLVGVVLGKGEHIIENCVVKNTQFSQTGSFGATYDTMIGGILGATYAGTATVIMNDCTVENSTFNNLCGYVEEGDSLIIDGYQTVDKPITIAPAPLEEDFLFPAGTNAVIYKDMAMSGDAQITHTENAVLGLSNVTAELDHDVIIRKSAGAIVIENCEFTLTDGAKLISVGEGGDAYQVFLINVYVNGELLTQENAGQYLEGISWFGAYTE